MLAPSAEPAAAHARIPAASAPGLLARRPATASILAASLAALALWGVALRCADWEGSAARAFDATPAADAATAHERDEAVARGARLAVVTSAARASTAPAALALGGGLLLAVVARLAGARLAAGDGVRAAALGLLPLALRDLATIPALVRHAPVAPADVPLLLPSSLAAFLPRGAAAPVASAASAADLFALAGVAVAGLALARAAGASRARGVAVALAAWAAATALLAVALPAFLAPRA